VTEPVFHETIPILRMFSIERAREFYCGFLGFKVDWEHRFGDNFPLYMQVSRGALVFHLSEHHGDGTPGTVLFVRMSGIQSFHAEISARDYRYYKPGIEEAPWGADEMKVTDPFGNTIRFSQEKQPTDA
jgi:catechol 2,3-dioxygenase-like lactoylglutathione lyase family enzyme